MQIYSKQEWQIQKQQRDTGAQSRNPFKKTSTFYTTIRWSGLLIQRNFEVQKRLIASPVLFNLFKSPQRNREIINKEIISMSDEASTETDPGWMEDVTFNIDTCNSDI